MSHCECHDEPMADLKHALDEAKDSPHVASVRFANLIDAVDTFLAVHECEQPRTQLEQRSHHRRENFHKVSM